MKRLLLLLSVFFFAINGLQAQVPQGIPYQAAARGANGQPLVNTNVKVRFSIIDSIATGTTVYQETHTATTNTVGLFSVNVGLGSPVIGTFAGINWGTNSKFMKVELDPIGIGSNYTDLGTQQMMSVPYALYAGTTTRTVYSPANNNLTLGMNYGGGIVGYILQFGDPGYDPLIQHGYIVAPIDQSIGKAWGCPTTASGTGGLNSYLMGSGQSNTAAIINNCGLNTPAGLCDALILNGYNDWYLPSLGEIQSFGGKGILIYGYNYWTSTECSNTTAYWVTGSDGSSGCPVKTSLVAVRAIRSF
ncbi:MAG: hypothetical protein ORN56_07090 [Chitinophagales bacterium]|nr:hypothetical protein [Chitinophagales bacterium]